jgi:hypothetical protein
MKLKMTEDGKAAVIADGKPVYVHDDGREVAFDAPATVATISRLNGEAKAHREAKESTETKLKAFEGIEDPAAARKALETVKNIDAGQLITAGKVDEIKRAAQAAAEQQVADAAKASGVKIQELKGNLSKLEGEYNSEKVSNAFANSKFVREKVAVPTDMLQALFGARFKREDGRLVGYDATGNKIYSRSKPGELADFDEALEINLDAYPNRDAILKGSNNRGDGKQPNGMNGNGGAKSMTRAQFDALDAATKSARMREGYSLND